MLPGQIDPGEVLFKGEHAGGKTENEIKDLWIAIFAQYPEVQSAFLARVVYGAEITEHISLCVACPKNRKRVLTALQAPFQTLFRDDQHVDIRFLDDREEESVRRVCRPFFEAKR